MDTYLPLGSNTEDLTSKPVLHVVHVPYQNRAQSKLQFFTSLSFHEFEFQVQFLIKLFDYCNIPGRVCTFILTAPAACSLLRLIIN